MIARTNQPGCDATDAYRRFLHENPFFLSSSVATGQRWSALCFFPLARVTLKAVEPIAPSMQLLRTRIHQANESIATDLPASLSTSFPPDTTGCFLPGWYGFLSYDFGKYAESCLSSLRSDPDFPLAEFTLYGMTLVHDNRTGFWSGYGLDHPLIPDVDAQLQSRLAMLQDDAVITSPGDPVSVTCPTTTCTAGDYQAMVRKALAYITQGDVYQVCLARRYTATFTGTPQELALTLVQNTPAAFGAVVPVSDGQTIVSTSPELFLQKRGRSVHTRPIKGTRPRSLCEKEDRRLHEALSTCEKERAELAMITDLLRNDLARVCEYGSICVNRQRELETYPHVRHAFSEITGQLCAETDWLELLQATFPGGSITGAPKIRAMQIIDELEPYPRGPYCGSIGRIGLGDDPDLDLNIAIRTVRIQGQSLSFDVGSGIVADSDPEAEDAETRHKARGIFTALGHEVDV